jgi:quercetin 2,3-dioxygenase
MIVLRKSNERGYADHGWLKSFHTFSFADYHDPAHMGFGPLRVINEDRVAPGQGFGTHGHRDMEIISYVLEGALEHKDSMGNGSVLRPGDVQRMSAGSGVTHSEFNHSRTQGVHFLQIWILPNVTGIVPSYEETRFEDPAKTGRLALIASPDGAGGSVMIHQDVQLFASVLGNDDKLSHALRPGRRAFVHAIRGTVTVNGCSLGAGDAAKLSEINAVELSATGPAELLLFDLP